MFKIIRVQSYKNLLEYREQLLHFESQLPNTTLFTSFNWISTWLKSYEQNYDPVILLIFKNETLVGFLPFVVQDATYMKIICKRLEIASLSTHGDIITLPVIENPCTVLKAVFDYLYENNIHWDYLYVESLIAGGEDIHSLAACAKTFKYACETGNIVENQMAWYVKIDQPWPAYYQSLSRNMKNSINKRRNKIERVGGYQIFHFDKIKPGTADWEDLVQIDQASWQFENGFGIFSPKNKTFYENLLQTFSDSTLDIWMMKGNDGPVVFEISLVFRNKVYLLRSEYVQNMKEYSPGTLLRLHALEWYFENGLSEYDMLGKFDESKKIWTDYFRKQEEVIIFNRTLKGKFIHTLQFVRENAKTLNLKK